MQKAGFIGLGIMGKPMAANLLKNGVALAAFTRSGVPDELIQAGARRVRQPRCGRRAGRRDFHHGAGYAGRRTRAVRRTRRRRARCAPDKSWST